MCVSAASWGVFASALSIAAWSLVSGRHDRRLSLKEISASCWPGIAARGERPGGGHRAAIGLPCHALRGVDQQDDADALGARLRDADVPDGAAVLGDADLRSRQRLLLRQRRATNAMSGKFEIGASAIWTPAALWLPAAAVARAAATRAAATRAAAARVRLVLNALSSHDVGELRRIGCPKMWAGSSIPCFSNLCEEHRPEAGRPERRR